MYFGIEVYFGFGHDNKQVEDYMYGHIRLELRVSVNSSTDRKGSGTCNIKL